MNRPPIITTGARGGSGATTLACLLAMESASQDRYTVVADGRGDVRATFGLPVGNEPTGTNNLDAFTLDLPEAIDALDRTGERLPSHSTQLVYDAGRLDELETTPYRLDAMMLEGMTGARVVAAARPTYLDLRALVAGPRPDLVVLTEEPGRSLTQRDAEDCTGLPVVTLPWSPELARAVDAGILLARRPRNVARVAREILNLLALLPAVAP